MSNCNRSLSTEIEGGIKMSENRCNCQNKGSNREIEKLEKIKAIAEEHKGQKGALIPVLHEVQEVYGYLPLQVQKLVSEGLDIPLAEIYGVVTFYTQFTIYPKGQYKIQICLGTACYVKGAKEVLEKLKEKLGIGVGMCTADGKFSLDAARCIGACGLSPVMMINDDVYGGIAPGDVEKILAKYN
jgi:NADP-reducing hydrogenase subunit HndA